MRAPHSPRPSAAVQQSSRNQGDKRDQPQRRQRRDQVKGIVVIPGHPVRAWQNDEIRRDCGEDQPVDHQQVK